VDEIRGHRTSIAPTTDPARLPAAFAAAFNSGDPAAVERRYEPGGVLVARPGLATTGADRAAANAGLQGLGVPIEVVPRHVYVAGDIALLVVDWVIEGTGRDGAPVRVSGTATDVARRGPDDSWRYVIDNPWGTA